MKKYMLLTAMIMALAAPGAAWSQGMPPSGNGSGPQGSSGHPGGEDHAQDFQTRKAEILKRMKEHLAETQQRIACVEAAANHESLRACMPQRGGQEHGGPGGPGGGGMMMRGGGQGGPGGEGPGGEGPGGEGGDR